MLELELASDFADIFAVKRVEDLGAPGMSEVAPSRPERWKDARTVEFADEGFPARTLVHLAPAPDEADGGAARYRLRLAPGERWQLGVARAVAPERDAGARRCRVRGGAARRSTRAGRVARGLVALGAAAAGAGRRRARADLGAVARRLGRAPAALGGERDGAGGRPAVVHDAVRPRHADHVVPGAARSVPRRPPARCARSPRRRRTSDDPERDAEPGKIVHELRRGKTALDLDRPLLRHRRRDAVVPRPPLGAVALERRRRDRARAGARGAPRARLDRLVRRSRRRRLRRVPAPRESTASTTRTGRTRTTRWSSTTARSRTRRSRRSRCRATSTTRSCASRSSHGACGATRRRRCVSKREAATLRERFDAAFWLAGARLVRARPRRATSGRSTRSRRTWAICCGAASFPPSASREVAAKLVSGPLWSGWGVRTLAADEPAFDPLEYHNGTVWPHDNSLIALGLAQAGRRAEAEQSCARSSTARRSSSTGCRSSSPAASGGRDEAPGVVPTLCAAAGVGRRNAAAPAARAARARAGPGCARAARHRGRAPGVARGLRARRRPRLRAALARARGERHRLRRVVGAATGRGPEQAGPRPPENSGYAANESL